MIKILNYCGKEITIKQGGLTMKTGKLSIIFLFLILIIILSTSFTCSKNDNTKENNFSYIGDKNGQSVFLDTKNGKIIYVNNSNRIIDYVDLQLSEQEISKIMQDKEINDSLQKYKVWNDYVISGTKYTLKFSTRFYNDKLLYLLFMTPYDNNASNLANTISIFLCDAAGFDLESFTPKGWIRSLDADGKPYAMGISGNIPITLENYLEITSWTASWRN